MEGDDEEEEVVKEALQAVGIGGGDAIELQMLQSPRQDDDGIRVYSTEDRARQNTFQDNANDGIRVY